MESGTNDRARCAAMVAALNAELAWELEADQQQSYVSAVLQHLPQPCSETKLHQLVIHYRQDHELVQALRDRENPHHEMVWADELRQVVRMVAHQGRSRPGAALTDADDLAQVALIALIQSLASFHYASRFSTWAYAVIARSIQRYLRDLQAGKRHGNVDSFERHPEVNDIPAQDAQPEAQGDARALAALISALLTEHGGERLAEIFRRSAISEQRLSEIGRQVGLSASRVSVLFEQARQVLQHSPDIRAWLGDQALREAGAEEPVEQ